ncbi:hypothetical protein ACHAWF_006432 [Thalassiosira exigua]
MKPSPPTPRKWQLCSLSSFSSPLSTRFDAEAAAAAAATGAGTTEVKASHTSEAEPLPFPLRGKFPIILIVSIALSSPILIDWRGTFFVDAAEPSTTSQTAEPPTSLLSDSGAGGDQDGSVLPTEKIIQQSSEEDSHKQMNEDVHDEMRDGTPPGHEAKAEKPTIQRIQRQKQRHMQRQKQHHIQTVANERRQDHHLSQAENDAYMHWCEKVLGIQSVVEIREFEYVDHLQIHWEQNEQTAGISEEFEWLNEYLEPEASSKESSEVVELPTTHVRGLAAKHDIRVGDIVISIPLYSLVSIPTTIDHDPVLSRILGPDARQTYGWTDTTEYEIPLLVIAVLYHRSLGNDSPLSHYMDILLGVPMDSYPFLWTDDELREKTGDAGEGMRTLVRGIRQDLYEIYDEVMGQLVKKRPEWFGPPDGYRQTSPSEGLENDWAYSYDKFKWAFAIVISRHHFLPIPDFDDSEEVTPIKRPTPRTEEYPSQMQETLSTVSEVVPPANQPTDSWVDLAKNEERVVEDDLASTDDDVITRSLSPKRSFLAPLADLINFGPPCLTGSYNSEEHVFELVATCPFSKGQEVTFWYSSDCSDVIIANFGFLHPLVPPCIAQEDWEKRSEEWEEKAGLREKELWEAYKKVDLLSDELAVLESQLVSCGCEGGERKEQPVNPMVAVVESTAEASHKLRNGQSPLQHTRVRGRTNEQEQIAKEMMEELG